MRWLRSISISAMMLAPAMLLAGSGVLHLRDGRSSEAAYPIPLDQSANIPLPKAAYGDAAEVLSNVDPHNGDAQISLAEAEFHAGEAAQRLKNSVQLGLMEAPASAEGWAFYAQILESSDQGAAAKALNQAFLLAPYDFFWAGLRAQLASHLWNNLSVDARKGALRQVRLLWEEPKLRDQILSLLATADGTKLMSRAYAGEPDTLRAINRWISATRRQLQSART